MCRLFVVVMLVWSVCGVGEVWGKCKRVYLEEKREKLKSRARNIRLDAVEGLGLCFLEARVLLLGALGDEYWRVRKVAEELLGRLGVGVVVHLEKAMRSKNPRLRLHAAQFVGRLGAKARRALGSLRRLTKDKEGGVRAAAYCALGKVGGGGEAVLLGGVGDRFWRARVCAIQALLSRGKVRSKGVDALLKGLGDKHEEVRFTAAKALGKVPVLARWAGRVVVGLARLLADEKWRVRYVAAESLGHYGVHTRPLLRVLLRSFAKKELGIRIPVALALGKMGVPAKRFVPVLIGILQRDKTLDLVAEHIMSPVKRVFLAYTLRPKMKHVMYVFAMSRALAAFGKVAVPAILKALRAEQKGRLWLVFTLGCIGREAASVRQILYGWRRAKRAQLRWITLLSLGRVAPTWPKTFLVLRPALKDGDLAVRAAAGEMLRELLGKRFVNTAPGRKWQALPQDIRRAVHNVLFLMKSRALSPRLLWR